MSCLAITRRYILWFRGCIHFAALVLLVGCAPWRIVIHGDTCLNAPTDICLQSGEPQRVSRPADLRIYELNARVDVKLLTYRSLVEGTASQLATVVMRQHDMTILPGQRLPLELTPTDKTRYLLFFFEGRETAGDRTWLQLVKLPQIRRRLSVDLQGSEVRVSRRTP